MDMGVDITYTIWRFNVQSWLEQYTEKSMMLHIYASLRGYPGRWVHWLEGRENLTVSQLLQWRDKAFGEVREGNIMIRSLYEIHQRDEESVEEYMLSIHEAVVVIHHAYPERLADQGKNLAQD